MEILFLFGLVWSLWSITIIKYLCMIKVKENNP